MPGIPLLSHFCVVFSVFSLLLMQAIRVKESMKRLLLACIVAAQCVYFPSFVRRSAYNDGDADAESTLGSVAALAGSSTASSPSSLSAAAVTAASSLGAAALRGPRVPPLSLPGRAR